MHAQIGSDTGRIVFAWGLVIACALVGAAVASAQDTKPAPAPPTPAATEPGGGAISTAAVEEQRRRLTANADLDDAARKAADEFYAKAMDLLRLADEHDAAAAGHTESLTAAPKQTEQVRAELANPPKPASPVDQLAAGLSFDQIEQKMREAKAELDEKQAALRQMEEALSIQQGRPVVIRETLTEHAKAMDEIAAGLAAPAPASEASAVTEARRTWLAARRRMRQAQRRMLEQEQASYDVRLALATERRNLAARDAATLGERAKAWETLVLQRRQSDAQRTAAEAAAEAAKGKDLPVPVRKLAEANARLAATLPELAAEDANLIRKLDAARARHSEVEADYRTNRQRIELAARSEAVGMVLRQQRQNLPSERAFASASTQRRDAASEAVGTQIEIDQERQQLLRDPEAAAAAVVDAIVPAPSGDRRAELLEQTRRLHADRLTLLGKARDALGRYLRNLNELDLVEQQTATTAAEYAALIDTHLLWLRSAPPMDWSTVTDSGAAAAWLLAPDNWSRLIADARRDIRRNWTVWIVGVGGSIVLIAMRRRSRRRLIEIASELGRVSTDRFSLTLRALLLTLVAAAGWAMMVGLIGWRLSAVAEAGEFTRAVGWGLQVGAVLWATLSVIREMCDRGGLGTAHFRWPEAARVSVRSNTVWLILVMVPAAMLAATLRMAPTPAYVASLGRLTAMAAMVGIAVFVARVLRPSGPVSAAITRRDASGWLARLRWVGYPLAIGAPVALALLAAMGYMYTAGQLFWRLIATVWLVLVLVIVHGTLMRALYVAARRLAFNEARRRRDEARRKREEAAQKGEQPDGDAPGDDELPAIEVPEIDIDQISQQTRKLVHLFVLVAAMAGLWAAWVDAMPALGVLNQVHVLATPLTIGMIVGAVIAIAVTVIAARNVPGFLEITLLSRLPFDAGVRYAATSLCRYAIVGVGIVATAHALGVAWDNVQWLIAALGVGLGFGLQEIVANFVSGIIILFERPFRVGDLITVGNTQGWVTRIRIRATTVTTFERLELIIPNKQFITGELVNWTLSDPVTRLTVPVGLAYGSDTDLAERLMLEAAGECEHALHSPEPRAAFVAFGDNALNYELRVWVSQVERRVEVRHQLHKLVDRKCREHGVVIAFPQRDVHLDQAGPLRIQLERAPRSKPEAQA